MADYCYGVIHFTSPAGWLPVHRDQLRAQRLVTSMGKLFTLPFTVLWRTAAFNSPQIDPYAMIAPLALLLSRLFWHCCSRAFGARSLCHSRAFGTLCAIFRRRRSSNSGNSDVITTLWHHVWQRYVQTSLRTDGRTELLSSIQLNFFKVERDADGMEWDEYADCRMPSTVDNKLFCVRASLLSICFSSTGSKLYWPNYTNNNSNNGNCLGKCIW